MNPNDPAVYVSPLCVLANARGFVEQHARCTGAAAMRCTCPCHPSAVASNPGAAVPAVPRPGFDGATGPHATETPSGKAGLQRRPERPRTPGSSTFTNDERPGSTRGAHHT